VDPSFFEARQYNPGWFTSYADDYYAAPVSALTLAPNADHDSGTVLINYQPGRTGHQAKITTTPAAARKYLKISNWTTTSSSGTSTTVSASRSHGSNTITVQGRVPRGRSGSRLITVHRPELYAAAVFRGSWPSSRSPSPGRPRWGRRPAPVANSSPGIGRCGWTIC
jgi:D-alanyl-D-alanine carboxypeptidase/D-alanyl-D-alanine-endopeptidase (penicillin-binding protein 4)